MGISSIIEGAQLAAEVAIANAMARNSTGVEGAAAPSTITATTPLTPEPARDAVEDVQAEASAPAGLPADLSSFGTEEERRTTRTSARSGPVSRRRATA